MKPVVEFDCKDTSGSKPKLVSCSYRLNDERTAEMQRGLSSKEVEELKQKLSTIKGSEKVEHVALKLGDIVDEWKCDNNLVSPSGGRRIHNYLGSSTNELCNILDPKLVGFSGSDNDFPIGGSKVVCVDNSVITDLESAKNKCQDQLKKAGKVKCTDEEIKDRCLNALSGHSGTKNAQKILKEEFA